MPARRKSSHELEATGAYGRNPSRRRNPPRGRGRLSATPPAWMNKRQAAVWVEKYSELPEGVSWTASDTAAFEIAVLALAKLRSGRFKSADINAARLACETVGLSPQGREKLAAPAEKEGASRWGEFGATATGAGNAAAN